MRKSALLLVGAALLIGLGACALAGPRSASADTTADTKPTVTVPPIAPSTTPPTPSTCPSTAPPATSPPTTAHNTKQTKTTYPAIPPTTEYQPSYTTYPYTTYPYSYYDTTTSSSTSTTSTTSTTIAGIEGKISNSPQTVPLATKASNGHVSGVFPILAYVGFGLAILIVLIRLFVTRLGGQDRRPIG